MQSIAQPAPNRSLEEVIPHAFERDGEPYRFVLGRIRDGVPLYLIRSTLRKTPCIAIEQEDPFAFVFTEEAQARQFCDDLARAGLSMEPVRREGQQNIQAMLHTLQDLGFEGIKVNGSAILHLEDLIGGLPCDGAADLEDLDHPMHNGALNAALLLLCQQLEAGVSCEHLFLHFFRQLQAGELLLPVLVEPGARGPVPACTKIPFFRLGDGLEPALLLFTDQEFYETWFRHSPALQEPFRQKLCCRIRYPDLRSLMTRDWNPTLVLNAGTCSLTLSLPAFLRLEASLRQAGPQETDPEDDPVPDFLRS